MYLSICMYIVAYVAKNFGEFNSVPGPVMMGTAEGSGGQNLPACEEYLKDL